MKLYDLESLFLERVSQLRIRDRVHMQGHLFFAIQLLANARDMRASQRLEVRSVAMDEPFHAFFDVENIRHAGYQMSAGPQQTRKLAQRLLRILDVLEPFNARHVVE